MTSNPQGPDEIQLEEYENSQNGELMNEEH